MFWAFCREAALAAVMDFTHGEGVAAAGAQLHELEVLLLAPELAAAQGKREGKAAAGGDPAAEREAALSARLQLMAAAGEAILDESMPAAGVPALMRLFRRAAERTLPELHAARVGSYTTLILLPLLLRPHLSTFQL